MRRTVVVDLKDQLVPCTSSRVEFIIFHVGVAALLDGSSDGDGRLTISSGAAHSSTLVAFQV